MKKIAHSINGVNGQLSVAAQPGARAAGCFYTQKWTSETRPVKKSGYGAGAEMSVNIRFDDECKNGHNSFAITAQIETPRSRRLNDYEACGCLHDDIARVFPELASFIGWHLFDSHAPMHYIANTVYHASNREDSRYEPGAPCRWETRVKFGSFPITFVFAKRFREYLFARKEHSRSTLKTNPAHVAKFEPVAVPYVKRNASDTYAFDPHYTVTGDPCEQWHEAPFKSLREAEEFCEAINTYQMTVEYVPTAYAKEKPRNLDAARKCANWPEATDEELSAPREELEKALTARLPAMMERFRKAIEKDAGFSWSAPEGETI